MEVVRQTTSFGRLAWMELNFQRQNQQSGHSVAQQRSPLHCLPIMVGVTAIAFAPSLLRSAKTVSSETFCVSMAMCRGSTMQRYFQTTGICLANFWIYRAYLSLAGLHR